jgi:hypothetical protein
MDTAAAAFIVLQFCQHGITLSFDRGQILSLCHLKVLQPVVPVHLVTQLCPQSLDGIGGFLHQVAHALGGGEIRHPVTAGALAATGFLVTAEAQMLNQFVGVHIPSL